MMKREQLTKTAEWIIGARYYLVKKTTSAIVDGIEHLCVSVDAEAGRVVLKNTKTDELRELGKKDWYGIYRLAGLWPGHGLTPGEQMAYPKIWMDRYVRKNRLVIKQ
jgi:hypothetical protein